MDSILNLFERIQGIQSHIQSTFQGFLGGQRTGNAPPTSTSKPSQSFERVLASELRPPRPSEPKSLPFEDLVRRSASQHNLPEGLLHAVIRQESNYNPNATSVKGAQGLMQLMPNTAKALGVSNPYQPKQNIDGGAKYLRQLLNRYDNNVVEALAAYNAGPSKVGQNHIPNYPETHNFIKKVINNYLNHKGGN